MREREKTLILFLMCEKAKYFYVTEFSKGYGGGNSDNEKIHAVQILRNF